MCKAKSKGGMGFKNLQIFNQSVLAKQGWRFLIYPDSLVSRVFKAKYFPTTDFLNASICRHPSYGFGRDLLHKGIRLRIGDGNKVSITKDP